MKLRISVNKFSSCDGCQLAFLNAGEELITLSQQVDIVHFIEAGMINPNAQVDIAFVEGSITTPDERERIEKIRANSRFIITIGACATAGGVQALRNFANHPQWMSAVYAHPEYIKTLATSTAIAHNVKVDYELWGCPVTTQQVMDAIKSLLFSSKPRIKRDAECIDCKRKGFVCVLVAKQQPCMGPVTQVGCGALCPGKTRACYACFGPKENPNCDSLGHWFEKLGFSKEHVAQQFLHINNQADAFHRAGEHFKGIRIVHE